MMRMSNLSIGDRVKWISPGSEDFGIRGTISKILDKSHVLVRWDDGLECEHNLSHFDVDVIKKLDPHYGDFINKIKDRMS